MKILSVSRGTQPLEMKDVFNDMKLEKTCLGRWQSTQAFPVMLMKFGMISKNTFEHGKTQRQTQRVYTTGHSQVPRRQQLRRRLGTFARGCFTYGSKNRQQKIYKHTHCPWRFRTQEIQEQDR